MRDSFLPSSHDKILEMLKSEYYPALNNIQVELKPLKILRKTFMITLPFSNSIYYNVKVISKCNEKALKAALMHELYHLLQFKRLNILQKFLFIPRYHLDEKFRRKHEIEAHMAVLDKGFGKELIELNKFVKSRYSKEIWDKKWSKYYLNIEEIISRKKCS